MTSKWEPHNNGAGKRIWFLSREGEGGRREYHENSRGWLIRYKNYETASRAAERLNHERAGRDALLALCAEAEYVVLADNDPGLPPVRAVAVTDIIAALSVEVHDA